VGAVSGAVSAGVGYGVGRGISALKQRPSGYGLPPEFDRPVATGQFRGLLDPARATPARVTYADGEGGEWVSGLSRRTRAFGEERLEAIFMI